MSGNMSAQELDALAEVRVGRAVVVSIRRHAVLGGRLWPWAQANGLAVRIDRKTKWGNPYEVGVHGDRATVIARYEGWIAGQSDLLAAVPDLAGKVLGCWCAPLDCHGGVLLRLIHQGAVDHG